MSNSIILLEIKKKNKIFYKKYGTNNKKRYVKIGDEEPIELKPFNEDFLSCDIIPKELGYTSIEILDENKTKIYSSICKVVVAKPENQWVIS